MLSSEPSAEKVAPELKGKFYGGDFFGIAISEIGDVALADVRPFAIGLAEMDGLIGFAIGGCPDSTSHIHVHIICLLIHRNKQATV
jgi:hypothetical protein